jgi:DNA polymerase IV
MLLIKRAVAYLYKMSVLRKIIHIDMDAFFASVEQRDFPELRGLPVAVGGSKDRGVVAAASYEARKFGVKSAMSSRIAARKCPNLIFKKARFDAYKKASDEVHQIFKSYTDLIEPLSLDEAYLDVTTNKKGIKSATIIANKIRKEIFSQTGLTASAGISSNKFVAKLASEVNKPNGFCLIPPKEISSFMESLPVSQFHGIGKVTSKKLNSIGVIIGRDLKRLSLEFLTQNFGKHGAHYFQICRGIDDRAVIPNRSRKSIGAEQTFEKDMHLNSDLEIQLQKVGARLYTRLRKSEKKAKSITLKIKFSDFTQLTRSFTLSPDSGLAFFNTESQIINQALSMLQGVSIPKTGVRLMGISMSNFIEKNEIISRQLTLDF